MSQFDKIALWITALSAAATAAGVWLMIIMALAAGFLGAALAVGDQPIQ